LEREEESESRKGTGRQEDPFYAGCCRCSAVECCTDGRGATRRFERASQAQEHEAQVMSSLSMAAWWLAEMVKKERHRCWEKERRQQQRVAGRPACFSYNGQWLRGRIRERRGCSDGSLYKERRGWEKRVDCELPAHPRRKCWKVCVNCSFQAGMRIGAASLLGALVPCGPWAPHFLFDGPAAKPPRPWVLLSHCARPARTCHSMSCRRCRTRHGLRFAGALLAMAIAGYQVTATDSSSAARHCGVLARQCP
jgi:hypothetical protein